jgi:hypothetical protein
MADSLQSTGACQLKSLEPGSALASENADELSLSGPALTELLRSVLGQGLPFSFRATGASMSPFIRDGDKVTLSPLQGHTPRRGDVVACVGPGGQRLIVHRVVGKRGDSYLVKGDAASRVDGLVPREGILGCVTKVERDGKQVSIGLGPERFLLGDLTRSRFLMSLLLPVRWLVRRIMRKSAG